MKGWLTLPNAARAQQAGRYLAQSLRLMVGIPDYETYLVHMRTRHPGQVPMDHAAFVRNRVQARYGGVGAPGRCC